MSHLLRTFFWLVLVLLSHGAGAAAATPAVALYYGQGRELSEFRTFDILVVDPDQPASRTLDRQALAPTQVYAYVSVTEVHPTRGHYPDIPAAWKLARNQDWKSDVIDQSQPDWPAFFAERVVAPLWQQGYRGFFLDTLDSYRLAKKFDETQQQQGLVRVIETLHQRFPGIRLIFNRGFDLLAQLPGKVEMVAAESLYQRWNAAAQRYEAVPEADRQWLQAQLRRAQQEFGLPALAIDYVAPHNRALARQTAARIAADGFIPWVSDADLGSIGVGAIDPVARRVLVLYNGDEAPALNYANAHRYLQMPLNHLGYVTDYADVRQGLPQQVWPDRYAGIVTWFSGFMPQARRREVGNWLAERIDDGLPLAIVGDFGMEPGAQLARRLGLLRSDNPLQPPLRQSSLHPMMGLEAPPPLPSQQTDLPRLTPTMAQQSTPLITFDDARGQRVTGGAITPWGGFVLDPDVLTEIPGTEAARWIVDPFAFVQQALRLPPLPVPDTTTENGRRLLLVHVDGDGFNSLAEFPGSPPAAQVLLQQVFEKYRIPQTMSVIEAEVAPDGLSPQLSPRLEAIARAMFKLPYMEIGSHTYSHPFLWDLSVKHGIFEEGSEAATSLHIPGYHMNLEREIVGSSLYINTRLAPPGKRVVLLQWSGDTAPSAEALAITARAGLLNINGGDTFISRNNPSLTAIGAFGIRKDGYLQVYAPITNENIYTHLWTGPFYGFERAIETFQMTDSPRRIKPVGIYYHTYSASKPAALKALHKVYDWALAQPLHPVHASDFARKVQDFYSFAIARDGDAWRLRGQGRLRTLRLPPALGQPDPAASEGVAGWRPGAEGAYLHLSGASATLRTRSTAPEHAQPYLYDANARLLNWQPSADGQRTELRLQGYMPLEWSLAQTQGCQVRHAQRALSPLPGSTPTGVQRYRLPDAAAALEILCPAR